MKKKNRKDIKENLFLLIIQHYFALRHYYHSQTPILKERGGMEKNNIHIEGE